MEFTRLYTLLALIGFYSFEVASISNDLSASEDSVILQDEKPKQARQHTRSLSKYQNAITEEERRGAPTLVDGKYPKDEPPKNTRGSYSTSAATHKHQHYYLSSGGDSHIAATGFSGVGGTSYGHSDSGHSSHSGGTSYGHSGSGHSSHSTGGGSYHSSGFGSGSSSGYGGYGGGVGSYGGHGSYGGGYGGGSHGGSFGTSLFGHGGGHGGGYGQHSVLALKGLLIPLAGIALLGAAAALTTNPVLLQLGVLNGRRRRRSVEQKFDSKIYPTNPYVKPEDH